LYNLSDAIAARISTGMLAAKMANILSTRIAIKEGFEEAGEIGIVARHFMARISSSSQS